MPELLSSRTDGFAAKAEKVAQLRGQLKAETGDRKSSRLRIFSCEWAKPYKRIRLCADLLLGGPCFCGR